MAKHIAIIIPGLGELERFSFLTAHWRRSGIEPLPFRLHWSNQEPFGPKLKRLLALIDEQTAKGAAVSLVGCSAGGSAALNAFFERKDRIAKVVTVCGWLRVGKHERQLREWHHVSESFIESVRQSNEREHHFSSHDRNKIMTMSTKMDWLVPAEVTTLAGATNISIPVPEHTVAILCALTIFSSRITRFLNQ